MKRRISDRKGDKRLRKGDPYLDRRSGEDRRKVYSLDYFEQGRPDRRNSEERRTNSERRQDCIRVDEWSSVCPDPDELDNDTTYVIDLRKPK